MDKVSLNELKLLLLLTFLKELSLHDLNLSSVLVLDTTIAISATHLTADFDYQVIEISLLGFKLPIAKFKTRDLPSQTLDLLVSVCEIEPQCKRFPSRVTKLLFQVRYVGGVCASLLLTHVELAQGVAVLLDCCHESVSHLVLVLNGFIGITGRCWGRLVPWSANDL